MFDIGDIHWEWGIIHKQKQKFENEKCMKILVYLKEHKEGATWLVKEYSVT